jgi:hypothetical protein
VGRERYRRGRSPSYLADAHAGGGDGPRRRILLRGDLYREPGEPLPGDGPNEGHPELSPLAQGGSDYEFWWSYGGKAAGSSGTVTFSVNGIIIVEDNAAVVPASLGRVKALYR